MPFTNIHYGARISPKKVVPMASQVRGKSIDHALAILELSKKRAAAYIRQALLAAKANADQAEADVRRLVVTHCSADSGPTMKRFQPKDRGRAHRILKRTCHITVTVDERPADQPEAKTKE
jgi:large subunit ribosomal protein L22